MLEANDELMTPGCPQCAVKHLSAALYYRARGLAEVSPGVSSARVSVAVACINLQEVLVGYASHLWYAVGALVEAEVQDELEHTGCGLTARDVRLRLEEFGPCAVPDALSDLRRGVQLYCGDWEVAHEIEAQRELPHVMVDLEDLAASIERIREEFFPSDTTAPAAATAEGGGESEMATKKASKKAPAFLKKEDPKAKQAACKGGKCKGGKCK